MSKEDNIEDVEAGTEIEEELLRHISESYLDKKFESVWKVAKIQIIKNDKLTDEYEDKKQDFLVKGRKNEELQECYGFFVENNVAEIELLASMGHQVRESEYNALGYNRQGVYVCKHADVCLQHSLVKHSGSTVMKMVMCKFVPGRPTTAIPRVASAAEFIEPTQGFDCHESVISPDPRDSLQNKFDRSLIYLYEINKLLQPSARPRQVLPYAVLNFTQNGSYVAAIDAEPTPEQRIASNARLQQVLAQMGKETLEAVATAPVTATPAPNPGPGIMGVPPGAVVPTTVALPVETNPTLASPTSATALIQGPSIGPTIITASNSLPNGTTASEQGSPAGSSVADALSEVAGTVTTEEPALSKVVTQLNAKLGPTPTPTVPHGAGGSHHHGRESVHSNSRSPAMAALPAPPQPPAHLTHIPHAAPHPGQPMFAAMNPHLQAAAAAGLPHGLQLAGIPGLAGHHPALAGQHLIRHPVFPGQPGLIPGAQPGLVHAQPGLIPGQPGLIPGQPGLLPGQLPGQHAVLPGHPGLFQVPGQPGLMFQMAAPNGLAGIPGLRQPLAAALAQHRFSTAEATPAHVPTAGYVANNVSGYTPANSHPPNQPAGGQPIPVISNGVVTVSSAAQQPMINPALAGAAGLGGMMAGVPGMMPGLPGVSMASMPQMAGQMAGLPAGFQAGGIASPHQTLGAAAGGVAQGIPQSMSGIMMAPSPAGAPAGAPFALAHSQMLAAQKLQTAQPGLVAAGPAFPMQNIAMAAAPTLKRSLPDPYAVLDKRLRLA